MQIISGDKVGYCLASKDLTAEFLVGVVHLIPSTKKGKRKKENPHRRTEKMTTAKAKRT